jgi:ribosome biogenesis protein Nip4
MLTCCGFAALRATQIARDKLVSLGTPVGKLTHSGKFRLTIGALELLSRYAKHKVSSEAATSSCYGKVLDCEVQT